MSLLRSKPTDEHLFQHTLMRGIGVFLACMLGGIAAGAVIGVLTDNVYDHMAQGMLIGSSVGGLAGVAAALLGVPSHDDSAEV
jgi:hypothetical protein